MTGLPSAPNVKKVYFTNSIIPQIFNFIRRTLKELNIGIVFIPAMSYNYLRVIRGRIAI